MRSNMIATLLTLSLTTPALAQSEASAPRLPLVNMARSQLKQPPRVRVLSQSTFPLRGLASVPTDRRGDVHLWGKPYGTTSRTWKMLRQAGFKTHGNQAPSLAAMKKILRRSNSPLVILDESGQLTAVAAMAYRELTSRKGVALPRVMSWVKTARGARTVAALGELPFEVKMERPTYKLGSAPEGQKTLPTVNVAISLAKSAAHAKGAQ